MAHYKNNMAKHSADKPYMGKKRKGLNALTPSELVFKTGQQIHDDVKATYWIQTENGTKYLSPAKYDTIEKLAAFKLKNPGCYMKNNLNDMKQAFKELPA